jgi:peptide/nickel transport system substrate-binding protein
MTDLGSSRAVPALPRRALLRLLGLGGGAALVAACAPAAPSAPAPTGAPATPATGPAQPTPAGAPTADQPKRGGRLTSSAVPLARVDAHCFCGGDALLGIWDTAIDYDQNLNPRPRLIESWEANKELTQFTFRVRQGVRFHSGRELTAEDLAYNVVRTTDPAKSPIYSGFVRPFLDSIEAVDKYSAVLKTKQSWPAVWDYLRFLWLVDSQADQQQVESDRAVGTGPFMLREYVQGDHALLVRNPSYWDQANPPYLDEVNLRFFTDPQALLVAFEAGAVDVVTNPPARDLARYLKDPNYTVYRPTVQAGSRGWVAHAQNPPTDNKLFRQALSWALDRERVNQTVWLGLGEPADIAWSTTNPAFDAAKNRLYTFDLDKARSLIQQSGVADTSIEIEWSTAFYDSPQVAEIWQQDLAKIGVNATLKPLDQPTWFQRYNARQYRNVSLVLSPGAAWNPATVLGGPYTKPDGNAAAFASPEWTEIVTRIQTEPDPAKRTELYARMNDYMLDQAFYMVYGHDPQGVVAHNNVRGVIIDPFPVGPYNRTWLA